MSLYYSRDRVVQWFHVVKSAHTKLLKCSVFNKVQIVNTKTHTLRIGNNLVMVLKVNLTDLSQ